MVMGEQASASTSPVLELRGVSKSFHGTKELSNPDPDRGWPSLAPGASRPPQLSRRRKRFSRQPG
jgi:hypothetical protein